MIKWIHKPVGQCPVQAEGWFLGYYFYFRARWQEATIEFSKSKAGWENDLIHGSYIVYRTKRQYYAGVLNHQFCKWLIYKGCFKFLLKRNKNKLV